VHLRAAHRVDCDVFALEQRIERDVAIAPSEIDTSAVAFVPQPKGAAGINPDFNSCAQVCAASCGDRRNVARGALRERKSIATSQKETCTNGVRGVLSRCRGEKRTGALSNGINNAASGWRIAIRSAGRQGLALSRGGSHLGGDPWSRGTVGQKG